MLLQEYLDLLIDNHGWLRGNITQCSFNRISSSQLDHMGFPGIVAVAMLSFSIFFVLLLAFSQIRKVWNFGRLAWVYDDSSLNSTYQIPHGINKEPHQHRSFFSWIMDFLHLQYSDVYKRCGQDAQHYLSFQRHLIYFLAVASIISPCVLIPLNMTGTASMGKGLFIKTTMANIRDRDEFLWPHFVIGLILLACMIGFIRNHSSSIHYQDEDEAKHTIFIHGLPHNADEETIMMHFNEAYPSCKVEKIHLCTDEYQNKLKDTCQSHIGLAYVTFSKDSMANLILKDFNAILYHRRPQSSVSDQLKISRWSVSHAHYPEDILWKNMSVCGWKWWARFLCINGLLFALLLYLTTPEMIVTNLEKWQITKPLSFLNRALKYFPAVSLWIFSAILDTVVYFSTPYEAHWYKSAENRMMMYKTFSYLIFIVLISPSLGLNSLYAFFQWLFTELQDPNNAARLECLFWPTRGAVVIHYVIIATFIGNAMDLVRIPEFLWYIARMASAKSTPERLRKMQTQASDFTYGEMYANILCVITVVMAYSNISPLVVPCGLLYMLLKHFIDTNNLYYVHLPTKQDRSIHEAAVRLSMVAPICSLMWQFLFCVLRRGWIPLTVIQGVILLILIMYSLIKALGGSFNASFYKTEESNPASQTSISREDISQKSPVHSPSVLINVEMEEEQQNTNASEPQRDMCNFYMNYP